MRLLIFSFIVFLSGFRAGAQFFHKDKPFAHTFSIVARDPETGELAVGVQSHWFTVGSLVSWLEAGVGAIATQSFIDKTYGYRGLTLLKQGFSARQVLDSLLGLDSSREMRQVAIVDNKGGVAVYTGKECIQYASDLQGEQFSVQSNMMLGNQVCESMARAFRGSRGKPIGERVLAALDAAQQAGGDIRGRQSAALIVGPGKASDKPWNDRSVDIRVDDNPFPLKELRRLYNLQLAYQHMNNGDLAVENRDIPRAMQEYGAAMKMAPDNLEMKFWAAISMANNNQLEKALPMLKDVFQKDPNWKELTKRLPPVKQLTVSASDLKRILAL